MYFENRISSQTSHVNSKKTMGRKNLKNLTFGVWRLNFFSCATRVFLYFSSNRVVSHVKTFTLHADFLSDIG